MSVKWIRIGTQMFEDEKIKLIESMPEADTILIVWVKLLVQAGKANASGYIYLSENIPFTEEMLSTIFNRPLNTTRLALRTLEQFGMITVENEVFSITNWDKHQNIDGLDKIREQGRLRKQRQREKEKLLLQESGKMSRDGHGQVTEGHATELELELELDKEKRTKDIKDIVLFLNQMTGKRFSDKTESTKKSINARLSDGYTVEDFKQVITTKTEEWLNDPKMSKYLAPDTLFRPANFEKYLNQGVVNGGNEVNGGHNENPYAGIDFGF